MKTSVALIGFMGTGKTAVGRALAEKLGREFIELDPLIEKKAGKTIPEIFSGDGEIAFRELEIAVTKEAAGKEKAVIACGGGVVLNKINIDRLREGAVIVYLTASPQAILKRTVNDDEERPLLKVPDPARTIGELLEFRRPFYERAAEITVDTSPIDVASVVDEIINRLKEYEGFRL
ncbi:MAG: shikimate kinase [Dehalococcoidales bacterium]|nr:shikimate kinase [Dehalococcoidales bacterium]